MYNRAKYKVFKAVVGMSSAEFQKSAVLLEQIEGLNEPKRPITGGGQEKTAIAGSRKSGLKTSNSPKRRAQHIIGWFTRRLKKCNCFFQLR